MASFEEYIKQVDSNLLFLQQINHSEPCYWDWQVTVCFYTAVHIINAHVLHCTSQHLRKHKDVDDAISPFNKVSPAKLDDDTWASYRKLSNLSRISRYLYNPKNPYSAKTVYAVEKDFAEAIPHLDTVIEYAKSKYEIKPVKTEIRSLRLTGAPVKNFTIKSVLTQQ